jgi:hypothetical protein
MKFVFALTIAAVCSTYGFAGDLELGDVKAPVPKDWKEEKPSSSMRLTQYKLPKAEGDAADAELAVFYFRTDSGSVADNLERQAKKFKPAEGKDKIESKVEKIKIGNIEATYQDLTGTMLIKKAPFDPKSETVEKANYRQLYVIYKTEKGDYYLQLFGPAKTIEKHKKDFDALLKAFK